MALQAFAGNARIEALFYTSLEISRRWSDGHLCSIEPFALALSVLVEQFLDDLLGGDTAGLGVEVCQQTVG